jgi:hypothetical protein
MAANFLQFDLKQCQRGDIAEVTLNRGANVRLMDGTNLNKFKRGQKHTYHGGLAKKSSVKIAIPRSGHWYVVVDMQGLRPARVNASVRTIAADSLRPLPPIRESRPEIAEIARSFAQETPVADRSYDVFISHASEDKEAVVRPLAAALGDRGADVWFDELTLRIGDSLREKIDAGIGRSRFGVVVLSSHFFSKGWTKYELDGLVTMSVSGTGGVAPPLARSVEGRGCRVQSVACRKSGAPHLRQHDRRDR